MSESAAPIRASQGSLEADYERAGFRGSLHWGTSAAVIVVDVCNAYVQVDSPLAIDDPDTLQAIRDVVSAARTCGLPVVFTRVEYCEGGADGGLFFQKVPALASFVRGNPLAEFLPDLSPEPGEVVVTKQYASAFSGTSLAATLRVMGVDTVVICGYSTSGCVRATALDALQNGFVPFVVSEACGDRSAEVQSANLFDLQSKYAEVVSLSRVLELLA